MQRLGVNEDPFIFVDVCAHQVGKLYRIGLAAEGLVIAAFGVGQRFLVNILAVVRRPEGICDEFHASGFVRRA